MDEKQRYAEGLQVRREVLGDAHVDRSLNALTEFNSEFQEMITRHAWGDIWTRPGLPRHTRSLITIAMLIGMNRSEELKLHLRAAASNGVTRAEIKEVLMQSAIYCGIPAANATFHLRSRCGMNWAWSPDTKTDLQCGLPYENLRSQVSVGVGVPYPVPHPR